MDYEYNLNDKLLGLCRSRLNRTSELKMLLVLGAKVDNGSIVCCCISGNIEHIKVLVEYGVSPNHFFTWSIIYGKKKIVKYLLETYERDVLIDEFRDPLFLALDYRHLKMSKYLYEKGFRSTLSRLNWIRDVYAVEKTKLFNFVDWLIKEQEIENEKTRHREKCNKGITGW